MIRRKECPRCEGTGDNPLVEFEECPRCHGTGLDEFTEGFEEMGVDDG